MTEPVFFHHASRTLILTDLIENFEPAKFSSRFWAQIMKWVGIAEPDGKTPPDWRATFRNRAAARESLAQMLAWQPEKIILAHGRCYETNGTAPSAGSSLPGKTTQRFPIHSNIENF